MTKKKDSFITDITNEDELEEIRKIKNMLNPDEKVLLVARHLDSNPGVRNLHPIQFMQLTDD